MAMQFAYHFPQVVNKLILVSTPRRHQRCLLFVFRCASLPMGSGALAFLRLPLVLSAA